MSDEVERILTQTVSVDRANVPFARLTVEQARGRADELRDAVGFGPTARVAPVARAWRELVMAMERDGAGTVAELAPDTLLGLAPKLWVVPPGGSLLA